MLVLLGNTDELAILRLYSKRNKKQETKKEIIQFMEFLSYYDKNLIQKTSIIFRHEK